MSTLRIFYLYTIQSNFFLLLHLFFVQIVGNLLYYRYINSAIVAPDAFDIVNVGVEKALSPDQRRNLGSIAKILQFAASNKGVNENSLDFNCTLDILYPYTEFLNLIINSWFI